MYVPEAQMGSDYLTVLVRTAAGAPDPVPLVREEVKRLVTAILAAVALLAAAVPATRASRISPMTALRQD
jgi:hypothetical protein